MNLFQLYQNQTLQQVHPFEDQQRISKRKRKRKRKREKRKEKEKRGRKRKEEEKEKKRKREKEKEKEEKNLDHLLMLSLSFFPFSLFSLFFLSFSFFSFFLSLSSRKYLERIHNWNSAISCFFLNVFPHSEKEKKN